MWVKRNICFCEDLVVLYIFVKLGIKGFVVKIGKIIKFGNV